jgi:hypothetical protein
MKIDEFFHKTLFTSIIVGPALAMTLPLVYWVQYKDMMLFPSFLYYVTASGCISFILYFILFVIPDNWDRLTGKKESGKQVPIASISDMQEEKTIPTLSPSVIRTANQVEEETMMYKKLYLAFVEKYVRDNIPEEDVQILLDDIYIAIDNRAMDLVTEGHKTHLPYEVKATSNFTCLNTEDLCHIGFVVKFFLKKRNDYGATFIKEVFPCQLKDVELSTLAIKLASNESPTKQIPIPDVCWGVHGSLSKKFTNRITEELICQI